MLRTLPQTRDHGWALRLAAIGFFIALTALSAQVKIYFGGPVPFTLQVLVVLLAGLTLGARDGLLAMIGYLGLILLNLPVDTNAAGAAALTGTTAGYLVGFVPAAFVAGWLVERGASRTWQRWLAALAGITVIYLCGVVGLKLVTGGTWAEVWAWGVVPFIAADLLKAVVAAAMAESGRAALLALSRR